MKWLIRILGIALLLVSVLLLVLLVLLAMELQAGLGELLGSGWLLLLMGLVSAALGVYMIVGAGKKPSPTEEEE